jgi:hypothetical protein
VAERIRPARLKVVSAVSQTCGRREPWLAAGVLFGIAFASSLGAADLSDVDIPFVGCPADGQAGPLNPPKRTSIQVQIASETAQQLAFYQAELGMGALAPRGWHCRGWYGSSGTVLAVTPQEIPAPYFPPPRIAGPVIYIGWNDAQTSGRFEVAITAARLFPKSTRDFIERIEAEGIVPSENFDVKPFPADQLHYLSSRAVEFITPAGKEGLATAGALQTSSLPVRGLVALDAEVPIEGEREIFVRLPADLSELARSILEWETHCFTDFRRCPLRRSPPVAPAPVQASKGGLL